MIPKKIHYCWFGRGEKPKLAQKCIASWKKYCPDYEIIEWNENNFDVNMNGYTKWCYENKKYAFLSDYVRLLAIYKNGGLYFDTDVSNPKNADINSGLAYGSVASGLALKRMLDEYEPLLDGKHGTVMCPQLNTQALEKIGLKRDGSYQKFSWGTVYPKDYFNPYESTTGSLCITNNTVSIHWYMGSCLSKYQKIRSIISKPLHRIFGVDIMRKLRK